MKHIQALLIALLRRNCECRRGCRRESIHAGRGQVPAASVARRRLSAPLKTSKCCSLFVSSAVDLLVMEIDDQRESPQPLKVNVAMLREPEVRTAEHLARTVFVESHGSGAADAEFSGEGLLQRFGSHRGVGWS